MRLKKILPWLTVLALTNFITKAQQEKSSVKIVGAMKNVMWKGQLYGNINLDTISNKSNLYGLGPVEYLAGEILIIDGNCYKSKVVSEEKIKVEESFKIKAPFFSYANVTQWKEYILPDSIHIIPELEQYIDIVSKSLPRPFMFKLSGTVEKAIFHIVNLPKGSSVSSPEEAHKGQINYTLKNEPSEIIGFFSTEHKTIFTHHDTYLHMHLITKDKKKMGHLDEIFIEEETIKLFLPLE